MGRALNPQKKEARQLRALQRATGSSKPVPTDLATVMTTHTPAGSHLTTQPATHQCDNPSRCPYVGTKYDCFWTVPEVIFNRGTATYGCDVA